MEGGFGFPLGGDPEELMRNLQEFAARQAESVAEAQREQFATLTLNTAVQLTAAALGQLQTQGSSDEQAIARSTPGDGNKGREAALAAIEMATLFKRLGGHHGAGGDA